MTDNGHGRLGCSSAPALARLRTDSMHTHRPDGRASQTRAARLRAYLRTYVITYVHACLLTHSLPTRVLTYVLTHLLTYLLTYLRAHLLTSSLTHYLRTHLLTESPTTNALSYELAHLPIDSLITDSLTASTGRLPRVLVVVRDTVDERLLRGCTLQLITGARARGGVRREGPSLRGCKMQATSAVLSSSSRAKRLSSSRT